MNLDFNVQKISKRYAGKNIEKSVITLKYKSSTSLNPAFSNKLNESEALLNSSYKGDSGSSA